MDEIYVVDLFYKNTKKHTLTYFKTLEGARNYAVKYLGFKNTIVSIHPCRIYK